MNLITFPSRKIFFKVTETLTKQTKQGKMKNPLHLFPTPQLQKQQFKVFRKKKTTTTTTTKTPPKKNRKQPTTTVCSPC